MGDWSLLASFLLSLVLRLVGPVVVLIIVLARARGRSRGFGIAGSLLVALGVILSSVLSLMLPALRARFDLPLEVLQFFCLPGDVVGWIGLLLLGVAVVVRKTRQVASAGVSDPWPPTR